MSGDLGTFAPGAVPGFSIAAPVGPIGVLAVASLFVEGPRASAS